MMIATAICPIRLHCCPDSALRSTMIVTTVQAGAEPPSSPSGGLSALRNTARGEWSRNIPRKISTTR